MVIRRGRREAQRAEKSPWSQQVENPANIHEQAFGVMDFVSASCIYSTIRTLTTPYRAAYRTNWEIVDSSKMRERGMGASGVLDKVIVFFSIEE